MRTGCSFLPQCVITAVSLVAVITVKVCVHFLIRFYHLILFQLCFQRGAFEPLSVGPGVVFAMMCYLSVLLHADTQQPLPLEWLAWCCSHGSNLKSVVVKRRHHQIPDIVILYRCIPFFLKHWNCDSLGLFNISPFVSALKFFCLNNSIPLLILLGENQALYFTCSLTETHLA